MEPTVQITFRHMEPSPALEADIRRRAAALQRLGHQLLDCRVTVEAPAPHHRKGGPYHVRVELHREHGATIEGGARDEAHAHEDPYLAVRDAFLVVRRRLTERTHGHGRPQIRGSVEQQRQG